MSDIIIVRAEGRRHTPSESQALQEKAKETNRLAHILWQVALNFVSLIEKEYGFVSAKDRRYINT